MHCDILKMPFLVSWICCSNKYKFYIVSELCIFFLISICSLSIRYCIISYCLFWSLMPTMWKRSCLDVIVSCVHFKWRQMVIQRVYFPTVIKANINKFTMNNQKGTNGLIHRICNYILVYTRDKKKDHTCIYECALKRWLSCILLFKTRVNISPFTPFG